MARTYKRDAGGRFASNGGSSRGPIKVGRAGPRGGKVGTRAEQRRNAKAQQARTQAFRSKAAPSAARAAWKAAAGAARKAARSGPRNGIRPTGGLPRPTAANGIRRTTGERRGPMALRANAVRSYRPVTPRGRSAQSHRQLKRAVSDVLNAARNLQGGLKKSRPQRDALMREINHWERKLSRGAARDMADSSAPGLTGKIARMRLSATPGNLQRAGRAVIRRRAARAAAAAARGSKPAARARAIYDRQLVPTVPGKPTRAKNNLRPGPSNTKGAPKPKRKPRKPRKPKG